LDNFSGLAFEMLIEKFHDHSHDLLMGRINLCIWRAVDPAWIAAHGLKRKVDGRDVYAVSLRRLPESKMPF